MLAEVATVLIFLVLLVLWIVALWRQPRLAVGVAIGLAVAWIGSLFVGDLRLEEIPVWLPPLPFAMFAFFLFCFGILAWYWGREDSGESQSGRPTSGHDDSAHGS